MQRDGYHASLYGHFGQGCVHCSIDFDLFSAPGIARYRRFVTDAAHLVELAVPRFLREEHDRLFEVVPLYLRRSDAEIAWDERARGA